MPSHSHFLPSLKKASLKLWMNAAILCFAGQSCVGSARAGIDASIHGVKPIREADLIDPAVPASRFVMVQGDEAVRIGRYFTRLQASRIESDKAFYSALRLGERILIVQTSLSSPERKTEFTGLLKTLPLDVKTEIVDSLLARQPELNGRIAPYLLDSTNAPSDDSGLVFGTLAVLFGTASVLIVLGAVRWRDPRRHPSYKRLARFGDPQTVVAKIDADIENSLGGKPYGQTTLLKFYALHRRWLGIDVIRYYR